MSGAYMEIHEEPHGVLRGYRAKSAGAATFGVVLLQEIFGVNENIRQLADQIAGWGAAVLAPDIFWRQAQGVELDPSVEADRQQAMALMSGLDVDAAVLDVGRTAARLRELLPPGSPVAAIGFCLGGKLAYLSACRHAVDSAVSYYGVAIDSVLDEARECRRPVLLHIAEHDALCPPAAQARIRDGLAAHADFFRIVSHPAVGHAFARLGSPSFSETASAAAHSVTRSFLHTSLALAGRRVMASTSASRADEDPLALVGAWNTAGPTFEVTNPATGEVVGVAPKMGALETERAIDAAQAAFPSWAALPASARSKVLRAWHDLILQHRGRLASLLTAEQGKPLAEADAEIAYAAGYVEWYAEEAKRIHGEVLTPHRTDSRLITLRQPVGVVGAITPWNFPAAMVTRKLAPALAAGCTVVLKPASKTPLTALALAALARAAGLPAGALEVVTGPAGSIAAAITGDPRVRKVTFTGSTEIGMQLMAACAPTLKRLSLELGGNAPFIVFDDADLDAAVEGAVASKFRNTGQTCVCANRLLVQAGVYEDFAERLVRRVADLVVAPGDAAGAQQGPLIDASAVAKVESHVADARNRGGVVRTGGRRHDRGGLFYEPTVITEAAPDMLMAKEETFGPVAPLFRFTTEREAIALANDTEFGLAAYLFTRDNARLLRVAEALECGIVGVNTGLISTEVAPFGGIKHSGFGREGSHHGMADYLNIKYVCIGGLDQEKNA